MSNLQPILTVAIDGEADVVVVRQRARRIAELLGFETQDQTRIATAVSEISRNAASDNGTGVATFAVSEPDPYQRLLILVTGAGRGMDGLECVLAGRGMDEGEADRSVLRARRLMDGLTIESKPGGTTLTLEKRLPKRSSALDLDALDTISTRLAAEAVGNPLAEVRAQNQELLRGLDEVKEKQDELLRLNDELENTNKGVVALYAELDQKAIELRNLNLTLEERVASAIKEREHVKDALRQSQKMEAVGQLTGGIAHDFNNMLQTVTGNLEIIARNLPPDSVRLRRAVDRAMQGAKGAAILTQQLLAFSRRQALAPKHLDVNHLVANMTDMLRRTIGEPVQIKTGLADAIWQIEADSNALENALLNLAVNARDAMPTGGTLTIETSNDVVDRRNLGAGGEFAGGECVSIRVADTGVGMADEVLCRVFEPFFTTKEVGKGTGLGLAMVYGFVKQSGGDVTLSSAEGRGTVVTLYFPRSHGVIGTEEVSVEATVAGGGNNEVILVVEDNEEVRQYSVEALRELGYQVLEAPDGPSALRLIEGPVSMDMMFTDVVLPGGMTGRELANFARARRPALKVLFTSGYARNALENDGRVDSDVRLLSKPFSFHQLAARVRDTLEDSR